MIRRVIVLAAIVLGTLGPSHAQPARDLLDAVRKDLVELQFESALAALEALLGQPGMSAEDRGEALILRSQAHVAFGDLDAAERDYLEILSLRASYVPDSSLTPAKAMTRFEKVQAEMVGKLVIASSPLDAHISVDGRQVVLDASGSVTVLAGEYAVRAERDGFDSFEQQVTLGAGAEAALQFALVPNARTLILETDPDEVEIWLDGVKVGETVRPSGLPNLPAKLVLENLPLGDHKIELRKSCFRNERFDEYLNVDLLDQSPRRIDLIRMTPAQSTLSVVGGPNGGDVLVDGISAGRLPIDPYTVCPGRRAVEVSFAGRVLWRYEVTLRESSESTLDVVPRPNAVLFGADEWPSGLSEFGEAFNTLESRSLPRNFDPEKLEDWQAATLPSGTDLAVAVVRASRVGARDRWFLYSPVLLTATVMESAPAVVERPTWSTVLWGLDTVDSAWAGNAFVVGLKTDRVPEGLEVGDRIVVVDGQSVTDSSSLRRLLAAAETAQRAKITWRKSSGGKGEGVLVGRVSPDLGSHRQDAVVDALRAAWAVVDAVSSGDRTPTALANLALLLSEYGHHRLSAETWKRVRWGDRRGVGEGTRQYYLGSELERIGQDDEAAAAFVKAAGTTATAFDDDSFPVAPAARDRLADLGVRTD